MRQVFDQDLSCRIVDFGQENLQINLRGDIAWVTFDGWSIWANGGRGALFETRIMERHNGRWKIAYSSFVVRQEDEPEGLTVCVDENGAVVRASDASRRTLRDHPLLTVSAGRLRAHRRDWDRALQAAFAQAGQHHGFFQTLRYANDMGGPPHFPVILGQTDEGGVAVVQFSLRDCVTYVHVDGDGHLDHRLAAAKTVFGLSDGQIRVAREIALGRSLKGAAGELGISVNTARTHLARLYDKTGVGTQAALVRLLLSVG